MGQFVSIGKIALILVAGSLAFVLVWLRLRQAMPFPVTTALAALVGATVGVGGLRLCLLAADWASAWLALPVFVVIVCVGLAAGMCAANAVAPTMGPAQDWSVGVGVFSIFWAIYGAAGTVLGFIMTLCVYIIRARGVP